MSYSATQAWRSYKQVATKTAAPGQLVLMLYDGAIRFLERALTGFDLDDPAEANSTISNNILRAQDIVYELNASLNIERGGELASTLRALYHFMDRQLTQSNLRKERQGIDDSINRLTTLRQAWAGMLSGESPAEPQTAPARAAA
jgi:flagellar protein FliS